MKSARVPVEVRTYRMPDGREQRVPVAPLSALHGDVPGLREALQELGRDYDRLLDQARRILQRLRGSRGGRADPRLYWDLGDAFFRFVERNRTGPVYLNGVADHVCRDLGLSRTMWSRVLRLRRLVPRRSLVDPRRPARFYLEERSSAVAAEVSRAARRTTRQRPRSLATR